MHCHYCDKALYEMRWDPRADKAIKKPHQEEYHNSDGQRVCESCKTRLIPKGTTINCPHCDVPVYELVYDLFRENRIRRRHLRGIAPQPDPYEGAYVTCRHCHKEIEDRR